MLGIVTVTYNSARVLQDFLGVAGTAGVRSFRVYAIDNASADGSAAILEVAARQDARIVLVRNTDNVGVAEANNQGIVLATQDGCSHVLLLNNDTVFAATLFRDLMRLGVEGGKPGSGAENLLPRSTREVMVRRR